MFYYLAAASKQFYLRSSNNTSSLHSNCHNSAPSARIIFVRTNTQMLKGLEG